MVAHRLAQRVWAKISPPRFRPLRRYAPFFESKRGLEIGGPSEIFTPQGAAPIYTVCAGLDNCAFSAQTVWDPHSKAEFAYAGERLGTQFTAEATALDFALDQQYDFVISSHMLEHSANPVKALNEWRRVLKEGGPLLLALPEKTYTFDHRRPVTSLEHFLEDFRLERDETDLTHLTEILELHDLARDPGAGTLEEFKARSLDNFRYRCLHHHIFDTANTRALLEASGFEVREVEKVYPFHIIAIAFKSMSRPRP
jgi:ubiquinone/menaquinone biosynthesis C-methylase UbiE